MAVFAEISGSAVANRVIAAGASSLPSGATWVQIDTLTPEPQIGWTYAGGAFVAPVAVPLTIAQQAGSALAAGLAITSTATPALDATYACDPDTISNVMAETVSILLNGAFTNGGVTIEWPDTTDGWHSFTIAQFKTLATALAAYVGALKPIMARNAGTLPIATTTIS